MGKQILSHGELRGLNKESLLLSPHPASFFQGSQGDPMTKSKVKMTQKQNSLMEGVNWDVWAPPGPCSKANNVLPILLRLETESGSFPVGRIVNEN